MQSNDFSGIFIGKNQITLSRIGSTNDFLKAELSKSKPFVEGTVIMAVEQFAGRGQVGSQWQSEKGKNLTASLLLSPSFLAPIQQFDLSIAISLAIREALQNVLKQAVYIKWPNDIYVNNKKIAGILIENILQGSRWKHAIIGIGVNVNQSTFSPDTKNPGSIYEILHETYDIQKLLNEICILIEKYYLQVQKGMQNQHKELYTQFLFGRDELRMFKIDGVLVQGKIVDTNKNGHLMVIIDGHLATFGFKEIEYLL